MPNELDLYDSISTSTSGSKDNSRRDDVGRSDNKAGKMFPPPPPSTSNGDQSHTLMNFLLDSPMKPFSFKIFTQEDSSFLQSNAENEQPNSVRWYEEADREMIASDRDEASQEDDEEEEWSCARDEENIGWKWSE